MRDATLERKLWRRRSMFWSLVLMVALIAGLPLTAYVMQPDLIAPAYAQAQERAAFGEPGATNPRSDTWRFARADGEGFTTSTGPYTTAQLISNIGENWRQLRNGPIAIWGGWIMTIVLALLAIFYLVRGAVKIDHGRSGMVVPRWSVAERTVHWFVGISFVVLAITGLSLLFGRAVLIPVFGHAAFAAYAQGAMYVHNFLGPVFGVALVIMILMLIKDNLPEKTDVKWFLQGGGLFGGKHPPAGRINAGEKLFTFWIGVVVLGLAVVISGFILDFPNFGQARETMAWAHIIHASAGMLWIAIWLGHAYLGTLGVQGAWDGMAKGHVDVNWAKQHHDLWYEDLLKQGVRPEPDPSAGAPPPQEEQPKGA